MWDARDKFVAWLRWYLENHPEEVPTQTELAKRLGVVKSAITPLFKAGSTRTPSLKVLLGAQRLIGGTIDHLLTGKPPEAVRHKR